MSFFPRNIIANEPTTFHPLFRLLDDFDTYNRGSTTDNHSHNHKQSGIMKSFTPKFDVTEKNEAYELHGELPGVDQKDIEIEFSDSQTVVIRGRTQRSFTSGTPPAGFLEGSKTAGAIEAKKDETNGKAKSESHKATVEDEDDAKKSTSKTPSSESQVVKKGEGEKPVEPQEKYWVSERSVGEFSRSFTFPVRVDSEKVQASMKNGVLSIVVPKAKKDQARKIAIN